MFVFFDFEASSLRRGSWPVEIGWVRADLSAAGSALITPASSWSTEIWDAGSEEVHGISLPQLRKHGRPPAEIAESMNRDLGEDSILVCDSPKDWEWLRILFAEAAAKPVFAMAPLQPVDPNLFPAWREQVARHDFLAQLAQALRRNSRHADPNAKEWGALKKDVGLVEHIAVHDAMNLALAFISADGAVEDEALRDAVVEKAKALLEANARPFRSWALQSHWV